MMILRAIADYHPHLPYFILLANLPKDLKKKYYGAWLRDLSQDPLITLEEDYWTRQKEQLLEEWNIYSKEDDRARVSVAISLFPLILGLKGGDIAANHGYTPESSIKALTDLTSILYRAELQMLEQTAFSHIYLEGKRSRHDPLGVWAERHGHEVTYLDGNGRWYNQIFEKMFPVPPKDPRRESSWIKKILPGDQNAMLIAGKWHIDNSGNSSLQNRLWDKGITLEVIFDGAAVVNKFFSRIDAYFP